MSCPYKVKPFPFEFCEGCMLNGCYPWNRNPLTTCSLLGGLVPVILAVQDGIEVPRQCASYRKVTFEIWIAHLEDLKKEAQMIEGLRKRAMTGKVYSSEKSPNES